MTPEQQLTQLVTQGYFLTQVSDLLKLVDVDHIEWFEQPNKILSPVDEEAIASDLSILQNEIGDRIMRPIFGSYRAGNASIWDRTEQSSTVWHNDNREGYNLFALVYFDTMTPGVNGRLYVRNPQGEESSHLPARGDCVVVNMKQGYEHRVDYTIPRTAVRRVANLCYNVPLLG
jgi:hypothetical protein